MLGSGGSWVGSGGGGGGSGTVTSVGLSLPGEFSVSGSPVTGTGTLGGDWVSQAQNLVFASPGGASGIPSFIALTTNHIPPLPYAPLSGSVSGTGNAGEVAFWDSNNSISHKDTFVFDPITSSFRVGDFNGFGTTGLYLDVDASSGFTRVWGKLGGNAALGFAIDFPNDFFAMGDLQGTTHGHKLYVNNVGAFFNGGSTMQLPTADGTAGQAMVTDGANHLSFAGPFALSSSLAGYLQLSGGTMTGTLTLDPAFQLNPNDAATIGMLSSFLSGLVWKTPSADLATTGNIVLAGEQTIDTVFTNASTVVVWQQIIPSENGVYISDAGAWTRRSDLDSGAELNAATISVNSGFTYAGQAFTQITATPNVGVDPIVFTRIGISYSAGVGLTLAGNTFSISLVPIANGGTNNTSYLSGSIPFYDGTKLAEDNDNIFWDNSNKFLGINTFASPTVALTVGQFPNVFEYPSMATDGLAVSSAAPQQITAAFEKAGPGSTLGGAGLAVSHRSGTGTAMTFGQRLGAIKFLGDPGGFATQGVGALIAASAAGTWSNSNNPTQLEFYTTPTGSTTPALRMRINNGGTFSMFNNGGFAANFLNGITANRFFSLPDITGTIALIPVTGIVTSNGSVLSSVTFPASGVVTSTGTALSSYARQTLKVTATQSITSVTPANITQLTSASLAVGTYRFKGTIVYQSASTTVGIGLRMNQGTATISQVYGKYSIAQAADGVAKNYFYDQVSTASNLTSTATLNANTDTVAEVEGTFTISVAGTCALQFRGETAGAAVSIRAGSYLVIEGI